MTTTTNFKPGIDIPQWRPNSPTPGADAPGVSLAWDHRNDNSRVPLIFQFRGGTSLDVYNPIMDDWTSIPNPAVTGTFGAGSTAVFNPSGPRGLLAAGSTTTAVVLATALPATVGANQLSDRGDGVGFRIRIIGKSAGGSGKINERNIIGNTSGTAPTLTLDVPLDWTPSANDGYELLSGQVFLFNAGLVSNGNFKYYDIATGFYSGSTLQTANLPGTVTTDSSLIVLSEQHVSCDRQPGTGFLSGSSSYDPNGTGLNNALATAKNCIVATASSSTTLTGSAMASDLVANEYVNFQLRITEDVTNPTGVGQRAVITSHTSGATPVFTVASWPVITPSATAKFVVENNNDVMLLRTTGTTTVYSYSISGNAWSTTAWSAAGNAHFAGVMMEQCYGIVRDATHNRRHSHIFCFRGNAAVLDMLDISAGSTGTWTNGTTIGLLPFSALAGAGTSCGYDPVTLGGKYLHIGLPNGQRMLRFNMFAQTMEIGTYLRYPIPSGSNAAGVKLAFSYLLDGATKVGILFQRMQGSSSAFFSQIIQF